MHRGPRGLEETALDPAVWEEAWLDRAEHAASAPPELHATTFRIVATRGDCILGRRAGEVIAVKPGEAITPRVCPYAESVLRVAAIEDEVAGVSEWCCPVNDHLLVFRREVGVR